MQDYVVEKISPILLVAMGTGVFTVQNLIGAVITSRTQSQCESHEQYLKMQ